MRGLAGDISLHLRCIQLNRGGRGSSARLKCLCIFKHYRRLTAPAALHSQQQAMLCHLRAPPWSSRSPSTHAATLHLSPWQGGVCHEPGPAQHAPHSDGAGGGAPLQAPLRRHQGGCWEDLRLSTWLSAAGWRLQEASSSRHQVAKPAVHRCASTVTPPAPTQPLQPTPHSHADMEGA